MYFHLLVSHILKNMCSMDIYEINIYMKCFRRNMEEKEFHFAPPGLPPECKSLPRIAPPNLPPECILPKNMYQDTEKNSEHEYIVNINFSMSTKDLAYLAGTHRVTLFYIINRLCMIAPLWQLINGIKIYKHGYPVPTDETKAVQQMESFISNSYLGRSNLRDCRSASIGPCRVFRWDIFIIANTDLDYIEKLQVGHSLDEPWCMTIARAKMENQNYKDPQFLGYEGKRICAKCIEMYSAVPQQYIPGW